MNKDGGPAYPSWQEQFQDKTMIQFDKGMTFRDRAAIAAMQGILSCPATFTGESGETLHPMDFPRLAYKIADAMVAEKGEIKQ